MTLFGVLWIGIIVFCCSRKNIEMLIFITLFSMVLQSTNVISFSGISVGPQLITNLALLFMVILKVIAKGRIRIYGNSSSILPCFLLLVSVCFSSLMNGNFSDAILRIVQLGVYIAVFISLNCMEDYISEDFVFKSMKVITVFVLFMGALQILMTSGIVPRFSLVKILFYNENADYVYFNRNNYTRLMSTFLEPSYCGCFLVASFFYFSSIWSGNKKCPIILISLLIEILLTRSSTAYVAIGLVSIVFILFSNNKKFKKTLVLLGVVSVTIMVIFGYGVLDTVLFSKLSSGSALTRSYWNSAALEAFDSSPLFGTGYKTARASSLILSILGELGLIGLIIYLLFICNICSTLITQRKKITFKDGAVQIAILAVVIAQFVACPDLDLCVFWMMLDLEAIQKNRNRTRIKEGRIEKIA